MQRYRIVIEIALDAASADQAREIADDIIDVDCSWCRQFELTYSLMETHDVGPAIGSLNEQQAA